MAGVTPVAALVSKVAVGGTAVTPFPPNIAGAIMQNPLSPVDQNLSPAEPLYVDPTGATPGSTPGAGWGTTFTLYPGQTWAAIPFQSTPTTVNAATSGHQ